MNDQDDLKKRVEALEQENRALREAVAQPSKRKVIIISEGSYQGHPTITFEAAGRPFTLGLRKAAVMLYCIDHVRRFVSSHKAEIQDWEILRGTGGQSRPSSSDTAQI